MSLRNNVLPENFDLSKNKNHNLLLMKTILVPTDFSSYSANALYTAIDMARTSGGEVIVLHNIETLVTRWDNLSETEKLKHPDVIEKTNKALLRLQDLERSGVMRNIPFKKIITHGVTSDEIIRKAKVERADVVVMAHGATAKGRDFIASTTQKVIRESACPVLSIKKELKETNWNQVVIPDSLDFDISKPFEKIKNVVQALGSTIKLLYINTPENFKDTETINRRMAAFEKRYPELKFERATYAHTDIEKGILQFLQSEKPDYVAMITYDHKNHPKYFVSVTETVVYRAQVPVLSVAVNSAEVEEPALKKDLADTR